MREIIIGQKEAGQRLDKYLSKYFSEANKSFIYKMLRKKNIVRNEKKADGSERLAEGDSIKLYFKEETFHELTAEKKETATVISKLPSENVQAMSILFENQHILAINKPAGMLSQKARPEDISLIEHLTQYLLKTGELKQEELLTFHPGICNRLDRNTSGIIIAGKTIEGLQVMGRLFKEREIDKFYFCVVKGEIHNSERIEGYLTKHHNHNKVTIAKEASEGADFIKTQYEPLLAGDGLTLLKVKLITGKSHQIRAHLNSIGHPIVGDGKYGDVSINKQFRKEFHLKHHLLHAATLQFPVMEGEWEALSKMEIKAPLPNYFIEIIRDCFDGGEMLCRHGIQED
ncbi:MAG: rRNA pseudouridine synthase [Clostridiales bacterium]|nr:rRNA pseudouridine synthase [Clostridiales bacterium]